MWTDLCTSLFKIWQTAELALLKPSSTVVRGGQSMLSLVDLSVLDSASLALHEHPPCHIEELQAKRLIRLKLHRFEHSASTERLRFWVVIDHQVERRAATKG